MSIKEKSICSIVGHKAQIDYLVSSISRNNLSHAYLFVGEEGLGKKKAAIFFAKSILCFGKKCGLSCPACSQIEKKVHPDAIFLEGKSPIKIEEIRRIISVTGLKPFNSNYKIIIIDNAERLTDQASNALLKTLEEPASHSVIILISKSCSSLLPTIVSRSQVVKFFKVSEDDMDNFIKSRVSDKKERAIIKTLSQGKPGEATNAINKSNVNLSFRKNTDKLFSLFGASISESFELSSFLHSLYAKDTQALDGLLKEWTIISREILKRKSLAKKTEGILDEYLKDDDLDNINSKMLNYVINYLIWSRDILNNPSSGLNTKLILDLLVMRIRKIKK